MRIAVIIVVVLVLAVGLAAYVRLAPSDPKRWHTMPDDVADRDFSSGAMRVIAAAGNSLRNAFSRSSSLRPNCTKHKPRSLAAIISKPSAVSDVAQEIATSSPPALYCLGVMPSLLAARS